MDMKAIQERQAHKVTTAAGHLAAAERELEAAGQVLCPLIGVSRQRDIVNEAYDQVRHMRVELADMARGRGAAPDPMAELASDEHLVGDAPRPRDAGLTRARRRPAEYSNG